MAFALTKAKFYKIDTPNAVQLAGQQVLQLTVTRGAAGDVALDLGNPTGTFWTAAIADVTYGPLALAALASIKPLLLTSSFVGFAECKILGNAGPLVQTVGAPGANVDFRVTNAGTYPDFKPSIALFNNAAPATITVYLALLMADNVTPAEFN